MSDTPRTDENKVKDVFEERVYDRDQLLPYKGDGGHFRFSGRFESGYPKKLQVYNYMTGWSECKNSNIAIRIQKEKELFPECTKGNHDWSRNTVYSINCKLCGIVVKCNNV